MNIGDWVKNQSGPPRLEKKYCLAQHQLYYLDPFIKLCPLNLSEIYWERKVNNIYFDDFSFSSFKDNLIGAENRFKIRWRWYGEEKKNKANLEIKMKKANLVYKLVRSLDQDQPKLIKELMKRLKPVLLNSYYRRYYLTRDKKVRLTIDRQLKYPKKLSDNIIIELKYLPEDEIVAAELINHLPLTITKNSKYVNGLASALYY